MREVLLTLFIILVFATGRGCDADAAEKKPDLWAAKGVTIELIATSDKGDVKYYRIVDYTAVCYVTVGELHGKTVTMFCK